MTSQLNTKKCFIIAEAGVNHNGSIECALEMIKVAANCGADAIKFQTFKASSLVTEDAETASYQQNNTGFKNQYEMLKALELKESDYPLLKEECQKYNIEFMSTPFDEESLDMLIALGMRYIKIPSGELTNLPFLERIALKNLPMILSTGMANLEEIEDAVHAINMVRNKQGFQEPLADMLAILHCTSNYPCPPEEANLKAIQTLRAKFGFPVGYSDHTLGTAIAPVCVGIGVHIYEKHFTLDKNMPGPDHCASLSPDELKEMIEMIRFSEAALGSPEKKPTEAELEILKIVRKSIALKTAKKQGDVLMEEDICFLRPGTGIEPKHLKDIVGRLLNKDLEKNKLIQWSDIK